MTDISLAIRLRHLAAKLDSALLDLDTEHNLHSSDRDAISDAIAIMELLADKFAPLENDHDRI